MPDWHQRKLSNTPFLSGLHAANPQRYPFLLDSAVDGPLSDHSLLFYAEAEHLQLNHRGEVSGRSGSGGFLQQLEQWYQQLRIPVSPDSMALPFIGGWFVFLGYELSGEIESRLTLPAADVPYPVAYAQRCPGAILRNQKTGECLLLGETPAILERIHHDLEHFLDPSQDRGIHVTGIKVDDPNAFESSVEQIKAYILAGDVFQVNLSRFWEASFSGCPDPVLVYRALMRNNPAPFSGIARFGDAVLLSSSPERLVEARGEQVQTRPIAGTRPRSEQRTTDAALSDELITHPKERAEHIMLIDLERNDLGRVCRPGSVEVDELMVVESYAHVHHIVSNVRGLLRDGINPIEIIRAVFPGGTITGCPKVRCMEIIAELEQTGRNFYTGSMGYISRDGQMDLNILIRSMLVTEDRISFRTGAGIVADSDPRKELKETEAKAKGLLFAIQDK